MAVVDQHFNNPMNLRELHIPTRTSEAKTDSKSKLLCAESLSCPHTRVLVRIATLYGLVLGEKRIVPWVSVLHLDSEDGT